MTLKFQSSKVKLLITNNAFCVVQRASAQSTTGIFRGCGVAGLTVFVFSPFCKSSGFLFVDDDDPSQLESPSS
jgi:hypothetical protein